MNRYERWAKKHLDIRSRSGSELNVLCPLHQDRNPSFRFNVETGLWICMGCKASGNIDQLARMLKAGVARPDDVDPDQLQAQIMRARSKVRYGIERRRKLDEQETSDPFAKPTSMAGRLRVYRRSIGYWRRRGFDDNTIALFELGQDRMTDRAMIPLRDMDGHLEGFLARQMHWSRGDGPKYREPKGYPKHERIFASWLLAETASAFCVLAEGPIDAMKVWQAGFPAGALHGSRIAPEQVRVLHRLGITSVLPLFDKDLAGDIAHDILRSEVEGIAILHADYKGVRRGADPGSMNDRTIKRLVETSRISYL